MYLISLREFYFIMIFIMLFVIIIGILRPFFSFQTTYLGFVSLSICGSVNAELSGCFGPWTFSLNIGLNMLRSDSFMSCLHSLLGYSTGTFRALQRIVLAALVHFLEISFKMTVGLYV